MEIITQYPFWFIILCLITGLIFASALYLKDKLTSDFHPFIKLLIASVRFVCVSILAFFLMEPILKNVAIETEKPIVVIACDNSESMVLARDSAQVKNQLPSQLKSLSENLSEDFDVVELAFGSEISPEFPSTFEEQFTDYSFFLDEINSRYSNRNLGAVIVASDGIYNKGKNPLYAENTLNVPFYSIAVGDTTSYKDALIQDIAHNRLAYLGNQFPVEVAVEVNDLKGKQTTLNIYKGNQQVFSKTLNIDKDGFNTVVPALLNATTPGINRYKVTLTSISGEVSTLNNNQDFYIDVLDNRQKIAIVSAAPHPDIAALNSGLSANENFEVSMFKAEEFKQAIDNYDLFIFHQLPNTSGFSFNLIRNVMEEKIPALFVWGEQTNFKKFNQLEIGFNLNNVTPTSNEVMPEFISGFSSFELSESIKKVFKKCPPLSIPFGNFDFSPGVNIQLAQRVGTIVTQDPLLAFNEKNGQKIGLLAGEGLWRWRLFTHLELGSHTAFDSWLGKIAQFLANRADKSLFRVNGNKSFNENERIILDAEVYNESFEPLKGQEITITFTNDSGEEFPYTFSQVNDFYKLDAGRLPIGNYSYESSVNSGGRVLTKSGSFSIVEIVAEQLTVKADHNLLFNLAKRTNGHMVFQNGIENLSDKIRSNSQITSISYERKSLSELINSHWLLFLILVLLGVEWLLRKRNGVY